MSSVGEKTEKAVLMLLDRVKVLAKHIRDDHDIFKDPRLESQVEERLIQLGEEVGKLTSLISSVGEQSVTLKLDGGESTAFFSQDWADFGVEEKIWKSEAMMSRFSVSFHRLKNPQLQVCLLSLSVFPGNTPIKKRPLVYWWIGEGIVATEETGEQLFEELLNLEDFIKQPPPTPNSLTVYPWTRRMLILLAQQSGFLQYTSGHELTPCDGSRRAFLRRGDMGGDTAEEKEPVSVFNVSEQYLGTKLENRMSRLQKVEVLQLGRWQDSEAHHIEAENSKKLFKGLGAQKHLKYLSLRGVARIETLPPSIGKLVSLLILDLRACHNLEKLPESISNLKKLTHLDVSECYLVESMPKGLPHLSNLRVLKGFVCSKNSCKIADLAGLKHLRKLSIRLGNQGDKDLCCLARFPSLRILTISWGMVSPSDNPVSLPRALTKLDLRYMPFHALPEWLQPINLPPHLKKLYIKGGQLKDINMDDYYRINAGLNLRLMHLRTASHGSKTGSSSSDPSVQIVSKS